MRTVMAIDPGTNFIGMCVLRKIDNDIEFVVCDILRSKKHELLAKHLVDLCDKYSVDLVLLELQVSSQLKQQTAYLSGYLTASGIDNKITHACTFGKGIKNYKARKQFSVDKCKELATTLHNSDVLVNMLNSVNRIYDVTDAFNICYQNLC